MEMKLHALAMTNFRGIPSMEIVPNGEDIQLEGQNQTGKTTSVDCYMWILFGRDSEGKTKFKLRPLDKESQPMKELVVAGEMDVTIDGEHTILRREQHEKLFTNGSIGYNTTYTIDAVVKSEAEYKAYINSLIPDDVFKSLSDLTYFPGQLHWTERRKLLLTIADKYTPPEEFAELDEARGKLTVAEYRDVLKNQHKKLKESRDEIPVRIDEKQEGCDEFIAGPKDTLTEKRREIEANISANIAERSKLAEVEASRNEKLEAKNHLIEKRIKREGTIRVEGGAITELLNEKTNITAAVHEASMKVDSVCRARDAMSLQMGGVQCKLERAGVSLAEIRNERNVAGEELTRIIKSEPCFDLDSVCPECERPFTLEEHETRKATLLETFTKAKEAKVDRQHEVIAEIQSRGGRQMQEVTRLRGELEGLNDAAEKLKDELESEKVSHKDLETTTQADTAEIDYLLKNQPEPDFKKDDEWLKINMAITAHEAEIGPSIAAQTAALDATKQRMEKQLAEINSQLTQHDQKLKDAQRVEDLRNKQKELSQSMLDIDNTLAEIEAYVLQESLAIEASVNDMFTTIQFKLYDYDQSGKINDQLCEPLLNGIPYTAQSGGEKIFTGIEIVNVLSAHYKKSVPLFIDNAESLTLKIEPTMQTIKLYATDGVETLTEKK